MPNFAQPERVLRETVPARVIVAAIAGMTLEWYDFVVFGFFARIIGQIFFPAGPDTALLMATATFGVGFVSRPLGAVVLGRYADRAGRRVALSWGMGFMAGGTALVGLAPGYAVAGLAAPVLVVVGRLMQGFAAAGEFGGATAYMIEHAPAGRKGLYASLQQTAQFAAALFGSLTGVALAELLSPGSLHNWGWRLPFLLGLLVGPLGLWLRATAPETPEFTPAREDLRPHLRAVLAGFGITVFATALAYVLVVYLPIWAQRRLGLPMDQALGASSLICALLVLLCPLAGCLSDRLSRTRLATVALLCLLLTWPTLYWVQQEPGLGRLCLVLGLLAVPMACYMAVFPALLAEALPASVRGLGVSVAYNLAVAIFGGFAPMTVEMLSRSIGDTRAIGAYLAVASLCGALGLAFLPRAGGDAVPRPR